MNYYRKNRKKAGLSEVVVAKKLGLKPTQYMAIERGVMKMPTDCIDKFQKIVKEDNAFNVESKFDKNEIEIWFNNLCEINNRGDHDEMRKLLDNFNINTYADLAALLGYRSRSIVSQYLMDDGKKAPFSFKERLFAFFHDNKNIQIPYTNFDYDKKPATNFATNEEKMQDWLAHLDLKKYMRDNDIRPRAFASEIGIDVTTLYNIMSKKTKKTSLKTIIKIKSAIENRENSNNTIIEKEKPIVVEKEEVDVAEKEEPVVEEVVDIDSIINKYVDIKSKICDDITKLVDRLNELEKMKETLLDEKIQLEKNVLQYDKFINDLEKINK